MSEAGDSPRLLPNAGSEEGDAPGVSSRPGGARARSRVVWCLRGLLALVLYLALAVWSTWPLCKSLTTALPMGTEPVATVPIFNAWTIWWNADRAAERFENYWDGPIFHPAEKTFAFSEAQPTTVVVAPLVWGLGTPVVAHNLYLLAALTLNGLSAYCLLRRIGLGVIAALSGGAMVEMLPIVHWQLGVLQLVPLFGAIWTIHALYSFAERPTVVRSLLLGAALAVTYWLCNYHGLFLGLLLAISAWWLFIHCGDRRVESPGAERAEASTGGGASRVRRWLRVGLARMRPLELLRWQTWLRLVPGVVLCVAMIFPIVRVQLSLTKEHDWERPDNLIDELSANVGDYTRTPWPQLLRLRTYRDPSRGYWALSPGYLKIALAAVGVIGGLLRSGWRRWTLFCVTLIAAAMLLSLGLRLNIWGWSPYRSLMDYMPGFAQIRNVFRFAFLVNLGVALLAACGLQFFLDAISWGLNRGAGRMLPALIANRVRVRAAGIAAVCAGGVALAVGGCAALEVRPPAQRLFNPPRPEDNEGWTNWLKLHTNADAVIACVPFPPGRKVEDYLATAMWMYLQTLHERPMVNGYSGFFPKPFLELKAAMPVFPDLASVEMLLQRGVEYCVVQREYLSREQIRTVHIDVAPQVRWVYGDDRVGIDIYELRSLAEVREEWESRRRER